MSIAVSMRISVELRAAMARERILRGRGGREKKQVQPGCERLHNVWRTHPQPPNPLKWEPLLRIREEPSIACL